MVNYFATALFQLGYSVKRLSNIYKHWSEYQTTSLRSKEMNLLSRLRRQLPYGASSDTLKPNFVREKKSAL